MTLEMEQGFGNPLDRKKKKLYETLSKDDINKYMYTFGISLTSHHYEHWDLSIVDPYIPIFQPQWDYETWYKARWGFKNNQSDEDLELEVENLDQSEYYDFLFERAVEYTRPGWAIFGLVGMMQGQLNRGYVEGDQKVTVDSFVRCLSIFSPSFLLRNKDEIMFLFDYYDECGYKLLIDEYESTSVIENEAKLNKLVNVKLINR